jgi:hypothetical protein
MTSFGSSDVIASPSFSMTYTLERRYPVHDVARSFFSSMTSLMKSIPEQIQGRGAEEEEEKKKKNEEKKRGRERKEGRG